MTLSTIGAAVTLGNIEPIFPWLCEENRPIEIQDFTSPNLLQGMPADIVAAYRAMLKPHRGVRGIHGPFFGLDLANLEKEFQQLISKRFLTALELCEQLSCQYMVVHSPFNDWMKLNRLQYPQVRMGTIGAMADILKAPLKRAADIGCTLVLENCDDTDPLMRMDAVCEIDHPNLRLSVDTGHAYLSQCNYKAPSVVDFIDSAESRLAHVHLQDCDGYADRHWLPGEGSITWPAVMDALKTSRSKPHLIVEVRNNMHRLPEVVAWLEGFAS